MVWNPIGIVFWLLVFLILLAVGVSALTAAIICVGCAFVISLL